MFSVNDFVMYASTGVCRIMEIKKERLMGNTPEDYYVLHPIYQSGGTTILVPVNSQKVMMRHLADQEKIDTLIESIPSVDIVQIDNDRERNQMCRDMLRSGSCEEWIKVLKNLRTRKADRTAKGKKFAQADDNFMKLAEKLVYEEFSASLQIPLENVEPYITDHLSCCR